MTKESFQIISGNHRITESKNCSGSKDLQDHQVQPQINQTTLSLTTQIQSQFCHAKHSVFMCSLRLAQGRSGVSAIQPYHFQTHMLSPENRKHGTQPPWEEYYKQHYSYEETLHYDVTSRYMRSFTQDL